VSNLHVVYRVHDPGTRDEQWVSYSFPHSIYVEGPTLDEVRSEFRAAVADPSTEVRERSLIEHLERPLAPGAYIRVAVDRRTLDRDEVAQIMHSSLTVPEQFDDFRARMPMASTGDAVMIACVSDDRLGWVFEQMTDHDAVGICALGPETSRNRLVWWSFLVGGAVNGIDPTAMGTLAGAGLSAGSTVAEFMRADAAPTGRRILANAS
jgi:hypothetical protein